MKRLRIMSAGIVLLAFTTAAWAGSGYGHSKTKGEDDIVATAKAAGSFSTLVQALEAADLVKTMQGEGPFTVFAPTDEAFAKLPEGTLNSLLQPENKEKLQDILEYHVVPGKVMSTDAAELNSAETIGGESLVISRSDGNLMIANATVTKADIKASNGVIHVIDAVMLPN